MRTMLWVLLGALTATAGRAGAATVAVTITGLSDTGYELEVSGIRKTGRLGAVPGPSTVRDLIDVGGRDEVTATLTFLGRDGVLATCPGVHIKVEGARAACEPMFVLTDEREGSEGFSCKTTCDRSRLEKSRSHDEDDDDDWVYAMSREPRARPLADGWSFGRGDTAKFQSRYSGSMSDPASGLVYSPAGNGSL